MLEQRHTLNIFCFFFLSHCWWTPPLWPWQKTWPIWLTATIAWKATVRNRSSHEPTKVHPVHVNISNKQEAKLFFKCLMNYTSPFRERHKTKTAWNPKTVSVKKNLVCFWNPCGVDSIFPAWSSAGETICRLSLIFHTLLVFHFAVLMPTSVWGT